MHVSYSQERYIFHVKRTDGLTVLCMADETAGSTFVLSLSFLISYLTIFMNKSVRCNQRLAVKFLIDFRAGTLIRPNLLNLL